MFIKNWNYRAFSALFMEIFWGRAVDHFGYKAVRGFFKNILNYFHCLEDFLVLRPFFRKKLLTKCRKILSAKEWNAHYSYICP